MKTKKVLPALLVIVLNFFLLPLQAATIADEAYFDSTTQAGVKIYILQDSYYVIKDDDSGYMEYENGTYTLQGNTISFSPQWSYSGNAQKSTATLVDACTIDWGASGTFKNKDCSTTNGDSATTSGSSSAQSQQSAAGSSEYGSYCRTSDYSYFESNTLCIPVVVFRNQYYSIALKLKNNLLELAGWSQPGQGSTYQAALEETGLLSIPMMQLGDEYYEIGLQLASTQPLAFSLKTYFQVSRPTDDATAQTATTTEQTGQSTSTQSSAGDSNSKVAGLALNFRVLVEYFEYLTTEQVAGIYSRLSDDNMSTMRIFDPFGLMVHYQACYADASLYYTDLYGRQYDCQAQYQSWLQSAQYSDDPFNYAFQQRDKILIMMKCSTGEISAANCATYYGIEQQNNNTIDQLNMEIIKSIGGGNCYVGDPGCS